MKLSGFRSVFFIAALIIGGLFVALANQPVSAQSAPPTPTPTPGIVSTLQSVIATQQIRIEALEREQGFEAKEREIGFRDINSQWKSWFAIAGIAVFAAGIFGVKGMRDLWQALETANQQWAEHIKSMKAEWEKRSQIALDQAIYRLDLANIPILLPVNENVGSIHRLLQQRKFEKIGYYKSFDELKVGILVVSLKGKNEEEIKKTLEQFKEFIELWRPNTANTGFIIYSPDGIKVPPDVLGCHDNLVTANFPSTVVSSIFTVGRGIEIIPPNEKEE